MSNKNQQTQMFFLILMCLFALIRTEEEETPNIEADYKNISKIIGSTRNSAYLRINHGIPDDQFPVFYMDYNNDAQMDIITYSQNAKTFNFSVYLYNTTQKIFTLSNETLFLLELNESSTITNVFAGNFQPNSNISFIVSVYESDTPKSFLFAKENSNNYIQKCAFNNTYIVIGDFDGDRNIEILYNNVTNNNERTIYYTKNETTQLYDTLFTSSGFSKRKISNYGNAMIDIDSDCRNDILITSENGSGGIELEIWRGSLKGCKLSYSLSDKDLIILDPNYGAFVLGDFNNDGFVDILFPKKESNQVNIYLNQYTPSHNWADNYCEKHGIGISKDQTLFNEPISIKLEDLDKIVAFPNTNSYVRLGDLKNKAYPGLILISERKNNRTVFIYHNDKNDCEGKTDCRSFVFKKSANFTFEYENANNTYLKGKPLYASYFDIEEDGSLDIIIATDKGIECYFNNHEYDTFFIKSETMLEEKKLSSLEVGVNYRYIVTDNNGDRKLQVSFQLAQTGNMALTLPYSLVGIGRSNNYIENFSVISNSMKPMKSDDKCPDKSEENTFTPIIPKSQLLITKKLTADNKVEWTVDLKVSPTENLLTLIIVIGVVLFVILVIIIILHIKEINEDKRQESEKFTAWFA